ncbi:MAG: hypothetical protein CUR32_07630 [Flavobacterium sp.]|nr:MAG: hypothetical protein CUR32_07630 [Flavobacterium sp.] [Flavobacterium sp. FEMGT703F]
MSESYKIYILGSIPPIISKNDIQKFEKAEMQLSGYNTTIINPINNMTNSELSRNEALRKNIQELVNVNAVYLLVEHNEFYLNSVELKLAFMLNITIIHQPNHIKNKFWK